MADLIEHIGRTFDAYTGLSLEPTRLEVSPECDREIKRLLKQDPEKTLAVLKVDHIFVRYSVNPKMIGTHAYKVHTNLRVTPPELAIRMAFANRSRAIPNELFSVHPKLRKVN